MTTDRYGDEYYQALADDLLSRVNESVDKYVHIAVDTDILFPIRDIVDDVERGLPPNYPRPKFEGIAGRRDMIMGMIKDLLGLKTDD